MHQDVVNESAVLVKQTGILRLADLQLRCGIGGNAVDQPQRLRAADFDFAHVADVEKADGASHRQVLLHNPGILNGHLPAPEIHHAGAQRHMRTVQRSALQTNGLHHGKVPS